jgi:uncharacterized protein (DUF58 family)
MQETSDRLQPLRIPTGRGVEQLEQILATLARVELSDGLTFAQLVLESASRLPRDATVIAVLPDVSAEAAMALGNLRRQGFAVTVVLVMLTDEALERCHGRLVAENVRDVRHLPNEVMLPGLCQQQLTPMLPYQLVGLV